MLKDGNRAPHPSRARKPVPQRPSLSAPAPHAARAPARWALFTRARLRAAPSPARAQRVFDPFFTCSRPHDVMLTSLMTSACPLHVFYFFYIFFNIFLLIVSLHPHL